MDNYRDKWQKAYEGAAFYRSEQNTVDYWNSAAENGGAGLSGQEHIALLYSALKEEKLLDNGLTLLDAGCGGGDYVTVFGDHFDWVTAADSSPKMTVLCRKNCLERGIGNVTYYDGNYMDLSGSFDVVFSCLNPASYCPEGFEKLLGLSEKAVVYMSMDTPESSTEPIYNGTNSVQLTERYLEEKGMRYKKIPFTYMGRVPFAFLLVLKH